MRERKTRDWKMRTRHSEGKLKRHGGFQTYESERTTWNVGHFARRSQ